MIAPGPGPYSALPEDRIPGGPRGQDPGDESKTAAVLARRQRRPKQLDAGVLGADVASFRLHLAAENKAERTIRTYTEAVCWFAAAHLLCRTGQTRWEEVDRQDVQRWVVYLLGCYSEAYAYQQYRALQQFFRWLAAEDEVPDPMAGLRPPKVTEKPVPFFTSVELLALEKACRGSSFAQRRDAAILAVFRATGIRLSEMAGIRYDAMDAARSDLDLDSRQIRIRGKGGKERTVKIDYEAARRVDRYLRARNRHGQAYRAWSGGAAGSAAWRCTRTGSGIISVIPGWTGAGRRGT